MNRADECAYDDKKQTSRTQKLRDKIALLEERLQELESESSTASRSPSSSALPPLVERSRFERSQFPMIQPELNLLSAGPSSLNLPSLVNLDNPASDSIIHTPSQSSPWRSAMSSSSSSSSASGLDFPPFYQGTTRGSSSYNLSGLAAREAETISHSGASVDPYLQKSPFTYSVPPFGDIPNWGIDDLPFETSKML